MCYLWRSVTFWPVNSSNYLTEPTQTIYWPSSETHKGMGLPQYLFLEKHQSLASLSQLSNLFYWIVLGTQYALWLFFTKSYLKSVTFINQVETAL